ncbi:MAG: hypothetical protein PVH19_08500, partial [Planctomycetia bacterium]
MARLSLLTISQWQAVLVDVVEPGSENMVYDRQDGNYLEAFPYFPVKLATQERHRKAFIFYPRMVVRVPSIVY